MAARSFAEVARDEITVAMTPTRNPLDRIIVAQAARSGAPQLGKDRAKRDQLPRAVWVDELGVLKRRAVIYNQRRMNLVTLQGVSKQFGERVLLDHVDLRINQGDRIGLIGANGSGKSTLLGIVAGAEAPDEGSVTVWGGVRTVHLPQEPKLCDDGTVLDHVLGADAPALRLLGEYRAVAALLAERQERPAAEPAEALAGSAAVGEEQTVERLVRRLERLEAELTAGGGWAAEAEARAVLSRLGIADPFALVGTLSGGQRKRVALARALVSPAQLLLLDEPTNHLDTDAVAWLEEHLLAAPHALLMVTHDRYFLERVVTRIVDLDRRKLVAYPGTYRRYLELRAQRHDALRKAEEDRRRLLRRELEWLRRGAKARSTKQKARRERIAEMERIEHDSGEQRVAMLLAGRRIGRKVLEVRSLRKAFGATTLFSDATFDLGPGTRLGIVGPNGAGKSTLLDILAGRVQPDAGSVTWGDTVQLGYLDQANTALDDGMRVLDWLEAEALLVHTPDGERVSAERILEWFLFPGKEQHTRIGRLSGGERRRLQLLRTLLHRPNVLFLDEPTNDLDLQTLAVLEEFLDHFHGCLVVVSHDRYFLDRNVDELAALEGGVLRLGYPTPFETFRRLRAQEAAAAPSPPSAAGARRAGGQAGAPGRGPGKLSYRDQRRLGQLEARAADLEAQLREVRLALDAGGADHVRLLALTEELAALQAEEEAVFREWLTVAERAAS